MVQSHLGSLFLVNLPISHFLKALVVHAFHSYVLTPNTNLVFVPKNAFFLVMLPIQKAIFVWILLLLVLTFLAMLFSMSLIIHFLLLMSPLHLLHLLTQILG